MSEYETIIESSIAQIFNSDFQNSVQYLISESIGSIAKNYSSEYKYLSTFAFYPPLNAEQIRNLTIERITSNEIKNKLTDDIFKQIELKYSIEISQWNSIRQITAKKYIFNAIEHDIDLFREKLLENTRTNITIQRFILFEDLLKLT